MNSHCPYGPCPEAILIGLVRYFVKAKICNAATESAVIGFSKPGALNPVSPRCFQRLGHCVPLSFTAFVGKIQATRFAGGH